MENAINPYALLLETLEDCQGDVNAQADAVYEIFLRGVFETGHVETPIMDMPSPECYRIGIDGFSGTGETPAEALRDLIRETISAARL